MSDAETYYNLHSREYADKWQNLAHASQNPSQYFRKRLIDRMLDLAVLDATDRVVEIGCGTGLVLRELLKHTRPVYGVDISTEMLKRVKDTTLREVPDADVILSAGDFLHLDLPAAFFDKILSLEVLRYIRDIDACFRNVRRIMKPNGMFVFSVTNPLSANLFPLKYMLREKFHRVRDRELRQYFLTERRLRAAVSTAGFEVVKFTKFRMVSMFPPIAYVTRTVKMARFFERIDTLAERIPVVNQFFDTFVVSVRLRDNSLVNTNSPQA